MPRCDTFCLLCKSTNALYIAVCDKDETAAIMGEILLQHLGIEVDQFNRICFKCWSITDNFHSLYERIHQQDCTSMRTTNSSPGPFNESTNAPGEGMADTKVLVEEQPAATVSTGADAENTPQFERVLIKVAPDSDDDDTDYEQKVVANVIKTSISDAEDDEMSAPPSDDQEQPDAADRYVPHHNPDIESANRQIREYFSMRCEMCPQTFATIKQAFDHYRQKHQRSGYLRCCGKKFFRRYVALRHVQAHRNPKLCECEPCQKTFASQEALLAHKRLHHSGSKPLFVCDQCPDEQFDIAYHLLVHKRLVHSAGPGDERFECDICGKSFDNKGKLAIHMRKMHIDKERHICHICAKGFNSMSMLNSHHRRMHSDQSTVTRVNCNVCNKLLSDKYSLSKHMLRHSSDVSTCKLCGKTFSNSVRLNAHMRYLHSGLTFSCTICPHKFKYKMALREHMAKHAGNNSYPCKYCPKSYYFAGSRSKHHKKSHFKEWSHERAQKYSTASVAQTNDDDDDDNMDAAED